MALCLPACPRGVWLGWRLHTRLDQRQLYRACYALFTVTASSSYGMACEATASSSCYDVACESGQQEEERNGGTHRTDMIPRASTAQMTRPP